jgi:predicted ester cyclase
MKISGVVGLVALFATIALNVQAAATQEEETNTAVARRIYEDGLSKGIFNVEYTPNFVGHGSRGRTFTHEAGRQEAIGWREAFPDLRVSVDQVVAGGDKVAVRWTARGTNTGNGNGITATGKSVETSGIALFRFEGGKVAEEWVSADTLGLMRQLDLLPQPVAPSAAPAASN